MHLELKMNSTHTEKVVDSKNFLMMLKTFPKDNLHDAGNSIKNEVLMDASTYNWAETDK